MHYIVSLRQGVANVTLIESRKLRIKSERDFTSARYPLHDQRTCETSRS